MPEKKEVKKEPTVIPWTESQKELFLKVRGEINNLTGESANYMINNILFPKLQVFAKELGVDISGQNWRIDTDNFQFVKEEKK